VNNSYCRSTDFVLTNVLQPRCGACHAGPQAAAAGTVDLISPGVRERLRGFSRICVGRQLATTEPSVGGHFFDKLAGAVPNCGVRMPPTGPPLPADEIDCLKTWVTATR
jgi:hypothetical protein